MCQTYTELVDYYIVYHCLKFCLITTWMRPMVSENIFELSQNFLLNVAAMTLWPHGKPYMVMNTLKQKITGLWRQLLFVCSVLTTCKSCLKHASWGGGTRPRKVRVGDVRDENLKLYLYKFAKNWGLFYILLAKKWGLLYIIMTKIYVELDNFARN